MTPADLRAYLADPSRTSAAIVAARALLAEHDRYRGEAIDLRVRVEVMRAERAELAAQREAYRKDNERLRELTQLLTRAPWETPSHAPRDVPDVRSPDPVAPE